MHGFGEATGLKINIQKIEIYSINCGQEQVAQLLENFPAQQKSFPCRYLGLPLRDTKLRKIDYLPLIDKVAGKLPTWKGKQIARADRVQLVKSVLTSIVTHHALVLQLPKWVIKKLERLSKFYLERR